MQWLPVEFLIQMLLANWKPVKKLSECPVKDVETGDRQDRKNRIPRRQKTLKP